MISARLSYAYYQGVLLQNHVDFIAHLILTMYFSVIIETVIYMLKEVAKNEQTDSYLIFKIALPKLEKYVIVLLVMPF